MIFDEFSPSRTRRTLTAGGRTLRARGWTGRSPACSPSSSASAFWWSTAHPARTSKWSSTIWRTSPLPWPPCWRSPSLATPQYLRLFAPIAYALGVLLLVVDAVTGHIGKGAQRWLDVGFMRFQPSEIMKLAVPMMCAWYMHERPLPPTFKDLLVMGIMIGIPTAMIVVQPDLGTALLIAASGLIVMLLAGLQVQIILVCIPVLIGTRLGGLARHP